MPIYNIFLSILILLLGTSPAMASRAAGDVKKANALFEKGDFDTAVGHYEKALTKDPQSTAVEYDLGTALYKKQNYVQAIDHLNKSLLSDDPKLQTRAHFNLGNAFYKSGKKQEKDRIDQAIASLEKSIAQYEKVLAADAKDADAKFNRDFVKKELERMKQKKQDQQNQQNQKQQNQQQNQEQNQNQEKNQQDQKGGQDRQVSNGGQQENAKPEDDSKSQKEGQNESQDQKQQPPDQGDQSKEKPKDQSDKNKGGGGQDQNPSGESQGEPSQEKAEGGLTPQEANMVLGDYERNEEPKGMLYFVPQEPNKEKPVTKDW